MLEPMTHAQAIHYRNVQLQLKRLGCRVNWLKLITCNIVIRMSKPKPPEVKHQSIGGPY